MEYTAVTQPQYANAEGTAINCWVKFDEFANPLPFTAAQDDCEEHSREIYQKLKAGKYGAIQSFVPKEAPIEPVKIAPTIEEIKAQLTSISNQVDALVSEKQKNVEINYQSGNFE